MKKDSIWSPKINPVMERGCIKAWDFQSGAIKDHGKYCIRFTVTFENGESIQKQKGGFLKKADAEAAKEHIIASLHEHTYVPDDITAKEFYDFWLHVHMLREENIAYNTYVTYRNIIYNYYLPVWEDKYMDDLTNADIYQALCSIKSKHQHYTAPSIIRTSFEYARRRCLISTEPYHQAIAAAKKKWAAEKKAEAIQEWEMRGHAAQSTVQTLDTREAAYLLYKCKTDYIDIFMALLFTITCGLRISEAAGVKFTDIDFGKKELSVCQQIGRRTDAIGKENNLICSQTIDPKTENGKRTVPVAPFVLDEVLLAKQRYNGKKKDNPGFLDFGFVSCKDSGRPYCKSQIYPIFGKLREECGFPDIKWHQLRKTYSTLLANQGINMKAVAVCMGHYSSNFTEAVYVEKQREVIDMTKQVNDFIEKLNLG